MHRIQLLVIDIEREFGRPLEKEETNPIWCDPPKFSYQQGVDLESKECLRGEPIRRCLARLVIGYHQQFSLLPVPVGLDDGLKPQQMLTAVIERANGEKEEVELKVRVDTPIEVEYIRNGGILQYVLRDIIKAAN